MLEPTDLAEIRAMFREEVASPTVTDRILTLAEAMAYTKHFSESAFYRWSSKWRVTSSGPGRYARSHLDGALDRESARRRQAKPAPRRACVQPAVESQAA